jgi:hypothetical protein
MKTELSPLQVVEWLREQSKRLLSAADTVEKAFLSGHIGQEEKPKTNGTVTVQGLENQVRQKKGRIKNLARHFGVAEDAIKALLEPASKVYVADRGWLRLRE